MKWGYFLRAESFYNVATYAEEVGLSEAYHQQSHGESFLTLAQSNFRAGGLYLLDEPEAALSPQRQLTLLMEIHRCVKEGSQFIIVSHSPILLGLPGADIYSFDGNIRQVDWEDTDSFRVTKMFIEDRESFLRYL